MRNFSRFILSNLWSRYTVFTSTYGAGRWDSYDRLTRSSLHTFRIYIFYARRRKKKVAKKLQQQKKMALSKRMLFLFLIYYVSGGRFPSGNRLDVVLLLQRLKEIVFFYSSLCSQMTSSVPEYFEVHLFSFSREVFDWNCLFFLVGMWDVGFLTVFWDWMRVKWYFGSKQ